MRWLRRLAWAFGAVVALILVAAAGGAVYQLAASARDRHHFLPPGRRVDMGGYALHLHCAGRGAPTVVFESGMGDSSLVWWRVAPVVAAKTRACVYDRGGLGFSDVSPGPRHAAAVAEELHTLLQRAKEAGPFVLVGHSLGGLYVRQFAASHPEEVAGLVLVDPGHENDGAGEPPEFTAYQAGRLGLMRLNRWSVRLGVNRLLWRIEDDVDQPAALRETHRALTCRSAAADELLSEALADDETRRQLRAAPPPAVPMVVLTAVNPGGFGLPPAVVAAHEQAKSALHEELARRTPASEHLVTQESGHYVQYDQPQLVIDAVTRVVARAHRE